MGSGWARGVAVAGLLLTATGAAGCDDGGSDGAGDRGGAIGGAFDPPTKAPSAGGDGGTDDGNDGGGGGGGEGGSAVGGVVSGPPVRFLPVERERPGPCPSGATDAYTDTPKGETGGAGQSCLHVDPDAGMTVRRTKSAKATFDAQSSQSFIVTMDLGSADAARFARLSGELAKRPTPQNRLAMVRGDKLLSAPSVMSAITGGKVQIAGSFSRDEAEQLARDLGGG